jgi:hypothetical protein
VGRLGGKWRPSVGKVGSGMWQASTSKAVAPACVSYGSMGSPPQASIERTDLMPVIWAR